MKIELFIFVTYLVSQFVCINSFSIPGFVEKTYLKGDKIPVYVNELDSVITQIPYEYYYLNYCQPSSSLKKHESENFGSILLGDVTQITEYQINALVNNTECQVLCLKSLSQKDVNNFQWMMNRQYTINMMLDNLPILYFKNQENGEQEHQVGFPIGYKKYDEQSKQTRYYIFNHLNFIVEYTKLDKKVGSDGNPQQAKYSIVSFRVEPYSINSNLQSKSNDHDTILSYQDTCSKITAQSSNLLKNFSQISQKESLEQVLQQGSIYFSYNVQFVENKDKQGVNSRWNYYKFLGDDNIHWFSIVNSSFINLFLSAIIAQILKSILNRDIQKYKEVNNSQDIISDDQGWKQLQLEVFRAPQNPMILSVLSGIGIQIIAMILLTLFFIVLGFINYTYRGEFLESIILLYIFLGCFSGYYASRLYKMFNGGYWMRTTILTAIIFPGANLLVFFFINTCFVLEDSYGAVPFLAFLELFVMWLCIQTPLVFLGSFFGFKRNKIENPCLVNPLPGYIPNQPWYLRNLIVFLLGGLLPFGTIVSELMFIMMSMWKHSFYYLFAFLFLVFLLMILACAETSIVVTYMSLCHGNYKWHWRSFFTPAFSAIYIFLYSMFYFTQLHITRFSSSFLYFGVMGIGCFTLFIFCGTIGFIASHVFVRKIYALIKVD